jgi:hypothetical protein
MIQGGYRKNMGCIEQIFSLKEIIHYRKSWKLNTYMAFLDLQKAYDSTWREAIWVKLHNIGIKGHILKMIKAFYISIQYCVNMGEHMTSFFTTRVGVRQGSVLSPILFSVFINDLVQFLESKGLGILVNNKLIPLLLFSDDIVLLAADQKEMKRILEAVDEFSRRWRFSFSHKKCCVMHDNRKDKTAQWRLGRKYIATTKEAKYLGILNEIDPSSWKAHTKGSVNKVIRRVAALNRAGINIQCLGTKAIVKIYHTVAEPVLLYGIALVPESHLDRMDKAQARALRMLMMTPSHMPTECVRGELGIRSLAAKATLHKLLFFNKLRHKPRTEMSKHIFEWRLQHWRDGDLSAKYGLIAEAMLSLHKIGYSSPTYPLPISPIKKTTWKRIMKKLVNEEDVKEWGRICERRSGHNQGYSTLHNRDSIAPYLLYLAHEDKKLYMQARCASLKLNADSTFTKDNTMCPFCPGVRETTTHFLVSCPKYFILRLQLQMQLDSLGMNVQIMMMDENEVKEELIGDGEWSGEVASAVLHYMREALKLREASMP